MKQNVNRRLSKALRRVAIAIVASGSVAAPAVYAKAANNLIVVPPTDLPEGARQSGEAMFLHQTVDGRTLLYIEHNEGAELAILDVTDPGHVKGEGSVRLGAAGAFDIVSTLGSRAELVRFRQGQGEAVLDLHQDQAPTLMPVPGLTLQGSTVPLGDDGFTVSSQGDAAVQPTRDYQVVDTGNSQALNRVVEVKQVREEISKSDTGTTFLLTDGGVYLIRRPAAEMRNKARELDVELGIAGAG